MSQPFEQPEIQPAKPPPSNTVAWLVGPMFLVLASWFVFAAPRAEIPVKPGIAVSREQVAPGARRRTTGEPATLAVGAFVYRCQDCHRLFDSPPVERRVLTQHTSITLRHGINDRCFNCHDKKNRERLILRNGTLIGFDEVPRLCSQCHGTVYRDWEKGTHGKTLGYWDTTRGARRRLTCNECHDPHAPAYPGIVPLPSPNTLRMGDQTRTEEAGHRHVPLRRWSMPHEDAGEQPPSAPSPEVRP